MPIYAYKCDSCGHSKDVLQKMSDPLLTDCPSCGKPSFKKQLTAAGFQLKGSGWYATDFKGGPAAPAETEGAAKAEPKTDGKQETKQESKSGGDSSSSSGSTSSGSSSSGDSVAPAKPKTASPPAAPAASGVSSCVAATGADRPRAASASR